MDERISLSKSWCCIGSASSQCLYANLVGCALSIPRLDVHAPLRERVIELADSVLGLRDGHAVAGHDNDFVGGGEGTAKGSPPAAVWRMKPILGSEEDARSHADRGLGSPDSVGSATWASFCARLELKSRCGASTSAQAIATI